MATQTDGAKNALAHDIVIEVGTSTSASPATVYGLLADPRRHLDWGGHRKGPRLVEIDARPGPLTVGSEFTSRGTDMMGEFQDRSVVTEAEPGRAIEFVTEARLTTKKGQVVDWTLIHRYTLEPTPDGCAVTYTVRTTRISTLPGPMRLFNMPVLSSVLERMAAKSPRAGVANLVQMAEAAERGPR